MADIKQLPTGVINKIAAGEVIERPASVVKELMENSVDAGATRIDVSIELGGSQLIRVTDNGEGIPVEQLPLAVASHATSKIRTADDLFSVETMGFRGEALASIAEVSEFCLRSRTPASAGGAELEVIGGRAGTPAPCGAPIGSTVEVRNLFYNTPVRRKFLRTVQTEMGHASEAFTRIALAHPELHFTLRHNERTLHDLPPVERWSERIASMFGEEVGRNLIWVDGGEFDVQIRGYVADPQINRAQSRMQYLFLNGRHIRDRALQHALGEAYRGLLMTGRYPVCFLQLQLSPSLVDVNVHPAKLEVRFADGGRVYSHLLGVIRNKFLTTDLTAEATRDERADSSYSERVAASRDQRREMSEWAKQQFALSAENGPRQTRLELDFRRPTEEDPWFAPTADGDAARQSDHPSEPVDDPMARPATPPAAADAPGRWRSPAIQLHNRYLVAETDEGMLVVDQHALHERILYEQIREKVLAGELETQRLLTPEPVSLTAPEAAAVLDAKEQLERLGVQVEPFGGDTVIVSSYPAILRRVRPAELLRQVVELLLAGGAGPQRRDLVNDLLNMVACKAAVKAGDRLTPEEIEALMEHREICQDSHHCPHGRPTSLVFSKDELDKRFKRI